MAGLNARLERQHQKDGVEISLARLMPFPYAEARTLQVYGLMYCQKGESQAARERLEAALAIFRRLGARKDVEHTEQLLAKLS